MTENSSEIAESGTFPLFTEVFRRTSCGATSNHTMPAADLAKVDRISLMGGSTEEIEALRHRYPRPGLTTWTKENRVQL